MGQSYLSYKGQWDRMDSEISTVIGRTHENPLDSPTYPTRDSEIEWTVGYPWYVGKTHENPYRIGQYYLS